MACSKFSADTNLSSGNQQSKKFRSDKWCPDRLTTQYLSKDECAKCCLMKCFQRVVEPIFTKILSCITEEKIHADTLEEYALKQGMPPKLFKSIFSEDHEINTILQNPDFSTYDLTLKFKCIRHFMNYNAKLSKNKNLKSSIINQMCELKCIRNDKLCHNREYLTKLRCNELADDLKAPLGVLLEILKLTWDKRMDICNKKKKMETSIDTIMIGTISNDDISYMCLQKILNHVAESALSTVTKLFCLNKNSGSYKKYFLRNGLKNREYKDTFFPEEKILLEIESGEIKPDVTLHAKIIIICKEWHHTLKNNSEAKEELSIIIGNVRGIRNLIAHNMLSMTPDECKREALNLGDCLRELGKFLRKIELYKELDVPELDAKQIFSDINHIMP